MKNLTPARHYPHVVTYDDDTAFHPSVIQVIAILSRVLRTQPFLRNSARNPVLDCAIHTRHGSTQLTDSPGIRSFGLPTRLTQAVRPS